MFRFIAIILSFSIFASGQDLNEQDLLKLLEKSEQISLEDDVNSETELNVNPYEEYKEIALEKELVMPKENFFGINFFDDAAYTPLSTFDVPLQGDYEISFGDELLLMLTGNNAGSYRLKVDITGSVSIPDIGKIQMVNLTISEAQNLVDNLVNNLFIGTEANLSVTSPSLKKISVIGAVKNPGTYIVNPFITVSEALKYASGIEKGSSLRSIEIISSDGSIRTTDLYQFLIFGDRSSDLNIRNGDTIKVNFTDRYLFIDGQVNRPMNYEYLENDSLKDILNFALGANRYADTRNIYINLVRNSALVTEMVGQEYKLSGDITDVYVPGKSIVENKELFIEGDINVSGYYSYKKGSSFSSFIETLDFSQEIYPFYFVIRQNDNNGQTKELFEGNLFDLQKLESNKMKENITISFFSRDDIETFNEFEALNERALNESNEIDREELNNRLIEDYLYRTTKGFIRLTIFQNGANKLLLPLSGKLNLRKVIDYFEVADVSEFNVIVKDKDYRPQKDNFIISAAEEVSSLLIPAKQNQIINVSIEGEIINPGSYTVNSSTTLQELYNLAGGFTDSSNQVGIKLFRESAKENEAYSFIQTRKSLLDAIINSSSNSANASSIDMSVLQVLDDLQSQEFQGRISGDFSYSSDLAKKLTLENGDKIIVPAFQNTVAVLGQVFSPQTVQYDKSSVNDYINKAGGFTKYADKQSIYIISQSGVITTNLNTSIQPGDTIIVPRNLEKISGIPLVQIVTQTLSNLALAAASINVLTN